MQLAVLLSFTTANFPPRSSMAKSLFYHYTEEEATTAFFCCYNSLYSSRARERAGWKIDWIRPLIWNEGSFSLGCRFILLLHHSFVSLIFCARLLSLRYSANILNDKLLVRYYIPEMLRLRLNIGKKLSYFYYYSKASHCLKITQNVEFEFWHLPPIFVLLQLTCLVTLFDRKL